MKPRISVVLATRNEEGNIGACLDSVQNLADEIVVVDGSSKDKTREVAESFGARVIKTRNEPIFHINKQKALDLATGDWILQLDADENVSSDLVKEIEKVINMSDTEIEDYQRILPEKKLFLRHQELLDERDGPVGRPTGLYAGFFIPRLNFFLGKFLRYGGVYPDGVIRLVRKGKAYFPAKSVHEQLVVKGRVGWLQNPLIHMADRTFARYLERNNRYVDLITGELKEGGVGKSLLQTINYILIKPIWWFLLTQVRHKGILDGWQGVVFSLFSALRFPRAYSRYLFK